MEGKDHISEDDNNITQKDSNKRISIPNEKILNHSKRNKRKSKIFKRKDSTTSNAENNEYIIDELKNRGSLFDDIKINEYLNEGEKFMSTLEQFELLSVNDSKENMNCNLMEAIMKINEESKLNAQPFKKKNQKTNFSQRFKDTTVLDYMLIKKYKN